MHRCHEAEELGKFGFLKQIGVTDAPRPSRLCSMFGSAPGPFALKEEALLISVSQRVEHWR